MNIRLITCALAAAMAFSSVAEARQVTVSTELAQYKGDGAYLAVYLTDANGTYQKTLWVAGKKPKYYKHLRDWARGSAMKKNEYDGMTGASVLSGKALKISAEVPDAMIDAGYQIRVDSAVEDQKDVRADVTAPLTTDGAGKPVAGQSYVKSLTYSF